MRGTGNNNVDRTAVSTSTRLAFPRKTPGSEREMLTQNGKWQGGGHSVSGECVSGARLAEDVQEEQHRLREGPWEREEYSRKR